VPQVLVSGNHRDIAMWRRREALRATQLGRPDLLNTARSAGQLTAQDEEDLRNLAQIGAAAKSSAV
jgi:tRNA (guanine37-N1)-methyltransferase